MFHKIQYISVVLVSTSLVKPVGRLLRSLGPNIGWKVAKIFTERGQTTIFSKETKNNSILEPTPLMSWHIVSTTGQREQKLGKRDSAKRTPVWQTRAPDFWFIGYLEKDKVCLFKTCCCSKNLSLQLSRLGFYMFILKMELNFHL